MNYSAPRSARYRGGGGTRERMSDFGAPADDSLPASSGFSLLALLCCGGCGAIAVIILVTLVLVGIAASRDSPPPAACWHHNSTNTTEFQCRDNSTKSACEDLIGGTFMGGASACEDFQCPTTCDDCTDTEICDCTGECVPCPGGFDANGRCMQTACTHASQCPNGNYVCFQGTCQNPCAVTGTGTCGAGEFCFDVQPPDSNPDKDTCVPCQFGFPCCDQ